MAFVIFLREKARKMKERKAPWRLYLTAHLHEAGFFLLNNTSYNVFMSKGKIVFR